ncbi:MAG: hypothetical protein WCP21_17545, partial [Armatimonadota bacterium]
MQMPHYCGGRSDRWFVIWRLASLALLAATVSAWGGPAVMAPHTGSAAGAGVLAPVALPAVQSLTLQPGGLVDGSYLRMYAPLAILGVVREVQVGKLERRALDGLVDRETQDDLLAMDWTTLAPQPPTGVGTPSGGTEMLAPGAGTLPAVQAPAGGASVAQRALPAIQLPGVGNIMSATVGGAGGAATQLDWQAIVALKARRAPKVAPKSLAFAPLWDGQVSTLAVSVTPKVDGLYQATFPSDSPFRVSRIVVFDGTFKAVGMMATRGVADSSSGLPWQVNAKAGQAMSIRVTFAPHFDLFSFGASLYKSVMTIKGPLAGGTYPTKGPAVAVSVPVSGKFLGLNLG